MKACFTWHGVFSLWEKRGKGGGVLAFKYEEAIDKGGQIVGLV